MTNLDKAYTVCLVLSVIIFYALLVNGWENRIVWLQNL